MGNTRARTLSILTRIFCRYVNGKIFCCEAKNKKSKDDILIWKNSLADHINIESIPIIILENKCDLLGEHEQYNDGIEELKLF